MICANLVGGSVEVAATQPADVTTCPVILIAGSDYAAVSSMAFPSQAQAGEAFAWGFSLVVFSYIVAWGCGMVTGSINK